jgi:hypothetical protein
MLFPKSKVQLNVGGKPVYFNGDDFVESAVRKKHTVKNNFRLFPFPHSDFKETSFDATKPNAIREFGINYDAAMTYLRSLTPHAMRSLIASSSGEGGKGSSADSNRKRPPKPAVKYDPSNVPPQKKKMPKKMTKAPITANPGCADSDESEDSAEQPPNKRSKPQVLNENRNKFLNSLESNPKKPPGPRAMKNAVARDVEAAIAKDKKQNEKDLPQFPTAANSPESSRSNSPQFHQLSDAEADDEQQTPASSRAGSPASLPLNEGNGDGSTSPMFQHEDSDEEQEEVIETDTSLLPFDESVVLPEPQLLQATGDLQHDMNALFGKLYDIEKSLFEIRRNPTSEPSVTSGNNFSSPTEIPTVISSADIVDMLDLNIDDRITGDVSWCAGIEFPFKEPNDVDDIDTQLEGSKIQRQKLVRNHRKLM